MFLLLRLLTWGPNSWLRPVLYIIEELLIEELPHAKLGNSRIPVRKYLRLTFAMRRPVQRNATLCNISMYRKLPPCMRTRVRALIQALTITINKLSNAQEEAPFRATFPRNIAQRYRRVTRNHSVQRCTRSTDMWCDAKKPSIIPAKP
jgi:hypothetical protein